MWGDASKKIQVLTQRVNGLEQANANVRVEIKALESSLLKSMQILHKRICVLEETPTRDQIIHDKVEPSPLLFRKTITQQPKKSILCRYKKCNQPFIAAQDNMKYCSVRCRERINNARSYKKRKVSV